MKTILAGLVLAVCGVLSGLAAPSRPKAEPPAAGAPRGEEDGVPEAEQKRLMAIALGDLTQATNEIERFYALNRAARNALAEGKKEDARTYAEELARLAPAHTNDWNHGNAVHDANTVLGRLALAEGKRDEAKARLLASAACGGSPQLNSFGPSMALARELLEKGEPEVVLEYLARCGTFWAMGGDRLKAWTEAVKAGRAPDFGPGAR
jgi:hypothetical protein